MATLIFIASRLLLVLCWGGWRGYHGEGGRVLWTGQNKHKTIHCMMPLFFAGYTEAGWGEHRNFLVDFTTSVETCAQKLWKDMERCRWFHNFKLQNNLCALHALIASWCIN